jgi:cholesterol transport system auxiliary component
MTLVRVLAPLAMAAALSTALGGCSISSMLGGGKPPATLMDLTPEAPDPGQMTRSASAGQAVTIAVPVVAKELRTTRVPAQIDAYNVQYLTKLQWVDTPDRLFQALVAETVRRTTSRVVLDGRQSSLDPGLLVNGQLQQFGYDAQSGQVKVQFDGALSTQGGTHVETRRFTATAPADGTAATVGPALNRAANQVALEIARWVAG